MNGKRVFSSHFLFLTVCLIVFFVPLFACFGSLSCSVFFYIFCSMLCSRFYRLQVAVGPLLCIFLGMVVFLFLVYLSVCLLLLLLSKSQLAGQSIHVCVVLIHLFFLVSGPF